MILEVICEIMMPRLMASIVDVGIATGDMAHIIRMGFAMLGLAAVGMVCGIGGTKAATAAAQGFGANLRNAMFQKIQDFSFADIDRFSSASLVTRTTNDVNVMQMTLAISTRMVVRAITMLIAALFMAISINAELAVVLLVTIPVLLLAVGIIMKVCNKLFETLQQKLDGLNNAVQENLVAVRVVKAFVRAGYEKTKFQRANEDLCQAGITVAMCIVAVMPSVACGRRLVEVLDTTPDIQDKPAGLPGEEKGTVLPAPRGRVEFKDVSFKYRSGTGDNVLEKLNFTVEPGQFTAIVGGTGVGKSSLVNLIPRFYDVTEGAVLVDGVDVRDYPMEELRSRIGMVLQNNVLFSGTIRENLLWGRPDATEEEMIQAAKDAQAYDFILSFPDGFDTVLDQGGTNVSGGQKQRLCIARAMLRKPAILILDDSTSAVDSATEAAIRESFAKNLKDTTVIIIAQRISSVQYADQILVLDDGTIVGQGTHDELMKTNEVYQEIYNSQQEGVSE